MKITYTPNPLSTVIELDDHEKEILRLKIYIKELEEHLGSASILLNPKNAGWTRLPSAKYPNGRTAEDLLSDVLKNHLNNDYLYGVNEYKDGGLREHVEQLLNHYLEELKSRHCGDCTAFPASCSKCYAESLLGVDTISGLNKSMAHRIHSVFTFVADGEWHERPFDEAMALLRNYDPKFTDSDNSPNWTIERFNSYLPKWKQEAAAALKWMETYEREHLTPRT